MVAHPSLFLLLFLLWADWQYVKAANLILLNYFFPNISCVPYHVYNRNYITYLKYEEFICVLKNQVVFRTENIKLLHENDHLDSELLPLFL